MSCCVHPDRLLGPSAAYDAECEAKARIPRNAQLELVRSIMEEWNNGPAYPPQDPFVALQRITTVLE